MIKETTIKNKKAGEYIPVASYITIGKDGLYYRAKQGDPIIGILLIDKNKNETIKNTWIFAAVYLFI